MIALQMHFAVKIKEICIPTNQVSVLIRHGQTTARGPNAVVKLFNPTY